MKSPLRNIPIISSILTPFTLQLFILIWLLHLFAVIFIFIQFPASFSLSLLTYLLLTIPFRLLFVYVLYGAYNYFKNNRVKHLPPKEECILVIGASKGIGKEVARVYAARGCKRLGLVGRSSNELEALKEEIKNLGKGTFVSVFACDVTKEDELIKLTKQISQTEGWERLDTLVFS
jgi:hypothetical protein